MNFWPSLYIYYLDLYQDLYLYLYLYLPKNPYRPRVSWSVEKWLGNRIRPLNETLVGWIHSIYLTTAPGESQLSPRQVLRGFKNILANISLAFRWLRPTNQKVSGATWPK